MECTAEALENSPAGNLLRRDPFVTYHVISSLFDEAFKRQKEHPQGELPLDTHECLGVKVRLRRLPRLEMRSLAL